MLTSFLTFTVEDTIFNSAEHKRLLASVIISIFRTMDASHFQTFFEHSASLLKTPLLKRELILADSSSTNCLNEVKVNDMLIREKNIQPNNSSDQLVCIKLIYACKMLLDEATYPKDWFDLMILRNHVVSSALFHIAERINKYHIKEFNELNKQIWFDYFECVVLLAIDPCLQLENFNENKRLSVVSNYGDIRVKAALEIKKMWFNLGIKFYSSIRLTYGSDHLIIDYMPPKWIIR